MSADNWADCPVCRKAREDTIAAAIKKAAKLYGKVSAEEWRKKDDDARKPIEFEPTLREDYQIGISESDDETRRGKFFVTYRAECTACGFEFSYDHIQAPR